MYDSPQLHPAVNERAISRATRAARLISTRIALTAAAADIALPVATARVVASRLSLETSDDAHCHP